MNLARAVCCIWLTAFFAYMAAATEKALSIERPYLSTNDLQDLSKFLEKLRAKHKLPALAAAVCTDSNMIAAGAVGVRKVGIDEPVGLTDKFHLGSCTKSMTALLTALLVERGVISWTNRVADSYPDWKVTKGAGEITLEQLLVQKSGLAYSVSYQLWEKAYEDFRGKPREQRIEFLAAALREKLESTPGQNFIYSNTGYALAGAMLEKARDRAWEDLVREEIFRPLQMTSAGFGPPSFPALVDQPWGHHFGEEGQAVARPRSDNPVSIAPAGAAHCSILDFAQYAAFHLAAAQGKVSVLSRGTLEKLYSPPAGQPRSDYALGWMIVDRHWAGGKALTHAGSNKMFYSLAWICPVKNRAFVVATNIGDDDSNSTVANAADEVIAALVERFLGVKP